MGRSEGTVERNRFLEMLGCIRLPPENGKQESDPIFRFRRTARRRRRSRERCYPFLRIPASNELFRLSSPLSRSLGLETRGKEQQEYTGYRQ
jgi:hypothetical protein